MTATTPAPVVTTNDYRPGRIMGMAVGTFLMTMFGSAWLSWGFSAMNVRASWLIAAVAAFAASLLIPSFSVFRAGHEAAKHTGPLSPELEREQRHMGMMFGIIFGAEGLAIFLAVNVLNNLHLEHYVISAVAAIVGLHFLPLARLYRVPMYNVVGTIMTLAAMASLALPSPLRETSLGLAMGVILWVTCALVVRQGFRMARATSHGYAQPGNEAKAA